MKSPGQIGYEAYCAFTDWKSLISGKSLPQWEATTPQIQAAWEECARAILSAPAELSPTYTDDTLMDFGKYTGKKLCEIDAGYFHWLYHERGFKNQDHPLTDYIRRNIDAFKSENSDLIWN